MKDETTPQDSAAMPPASAGSVPAEPVAWLVTGDGYEYVTLLKEHAEVVAEEEDGVVVPLYRNTPATPTAAELDAMRKEISELRNDLALLRDSFDWHCGRKDG